MRIRNNRLKIQRILPIQKIDIPTIFQEKIDRALEYSTSALLDYIIVVSEVNRITKENLSILKKLKNKLNKLEKAGYRAKRRKYEFFMSQTIWSGHEIDENGIKLYEEKVEAILQLKPPENTKELKSFLGAIQYIAKFPPKLSERTD